MRKEKLEELKQLMDMYKTISQSKVKVRKGKFLKIGVATYKLNNGKTITREELIKNKGYSNASIILPITPSEEVLLTVQPRVLTIDGVEIELPAGYIDKKETGADAAIRELREETGYTPGNIIKVGEYYQDQGCSRAFNECFLATGCIKTHEPKLDKDEYISLFTCTYDELLELVEMDYIKDAGSIITIEKSKRLLKKIKDIKGDIYDKL